MIWVPSNDTSKAAKSAFVFNAPTIRTEYCSVPVSTKYGAGSHLVLNSNPEIEIDVMPLVVLRTPSVLLFVSRDYPRNRG